VQLSTGGSVHDPLDARLKVLDAAPDSCSLTMGTVNFGDDVFMNPWGFITDLYQLSQERRVVPEFELFDLGHVQALHRLLAKYGLPYGGRVHADLVMGVPGGMPGTADALVAAVQGLPEEVTSWSATGVGRTTLPVAMAALSKGGHLRVGMEDVLTFARGRPVQHNAELVERAASLATLAQRPPMKPDAARDLLQIRAAS
jgi:3-keto-5-aminohexanoate cleavage enzyme